MSKTKKKIKIGAIIFKIKRENLRDNMGETFFNQSEIKVRKGMENRIAQETLLHEIIEIALVQSGHHGKVEEGAIDAIAYTLLDIGLVKLDKILDCNS